MMKKYIFNIGKSTWRMLILALCVMLTSCTERIDLTTNNAAPRLVITGYITTEARQHTVSVSQTMPYLGAAEHITFSHAVVKINDDELSAAGNGVYVTDSSFCGVPGHTYKLDVELDYNGDGVSERYTAETTMPPMHTLDSITLFPAFENMPADDPTILVLVHFQDLGNVINTFGAHLYINDTLYSNKIQRYFLNPFDLYAADGMYINFLPYALRKEMRWDNEQRKYIYSGDTITVELNMIAPDYFEFIRTASLEISGGNPLFAGPPANVPSNISGGALGYFGSYTISRATTVLSDKYGFPKRK
ncbi:MAG: DUF4249 domain-containing protein [Prevotellaceae bacterium]|jgi:hypothetical protein|nr:DUF4249 domain-containing protein [Prevotellaceae bacterium]